MAEIVMLRPNSKPDADSCRKLYQRMQFETSNVVFAPAFCKKAEEIYRTRDFKRPEVEDVA